MALSLCSTFSISDFPRRGCHCSKIWPSSPHPMVNINSRRNVRLPNRNCGVFASLEARIEGETARMDADGNGSRRPLRVGIICGGPSEERGISLNSARSVLDHVQLTTFGIRTIPKEVWSIQKILNTSISTVWNILTRNLQCKTLCVKPTHDGCSTGVARLCSKDDLRVYVKALKECLLQLPPNSLSKAHGVIEMPNPPPNSLIFESFIETDEIIVSSKSASGNTGNLMWKGNSQWVEVTVGVIGICGDMHSLTPSITVKEAGDILSLEEKFQGGTGINLTPPPVTIISEKVLQKCKERIEMIANTLELEGFSRIDAFVNVHSGEVLVIEVNTVPGMTPSTVLIHQALAEEPAIYPHDFFRAVLDLALQRS